MNDQRPIDGADRVVQLKHLPDRSHDAHPSNFQHLLALSEPAIKAYAETEQALANGNLTTKQREQIALAVAEINDSDYCLAAHSATAKNSGLSEQEILDARRATAPDLKARAMLRFTQLVTLQRGDIKPEVLSAIFKAGFSQPEVTEIIANIALNIFTNYLNTAFRTEVDPPTPASQQSTQQAERPANYQGRWFDTIPFF